MDVVLKEMKLLEGESIYPPRENIEGMSTYQKIGRVNDFALIVFVGFLDGYAFVYPSFVHHGIVLPCILVFVSN
jgi:hypothetical protein